MGTDRKVSTRIYPTFRSLCEAVSLRLVPGHHSKDAMGIVWDRNKQAYTKCLGTISITLTDLANDEVSNSPRSDDACMPFL